MPTDLVKYKAVIHIANVYIVLHVYPSISMWAFVSTV